MRFRNPRSIWLTLAVLAVFGLAIWLRFRLLGYTYMGGDQSQEIGGTLVWLNGGPWPLTALKSSFGVFNPPLIRYLYAVPLWIARDILGVVWWTAIANLAGVVIVGVAARRVFGWRVAWWATVLYVVNPWAVYYARVIWMQTFVPFFANLLLACTLLYFAEAPRARYLVVGALALAGAIQVHLTSAVLGGVIVCLALILSSRPAWRPLGLGIALAALTFAPYLLFQWQTNWQDVRTLWESRHLPANVNLASFLIALDLMQSQGVYSVAGSVQSLWQARDPLGPVADRLVAFVLPAALGAAIAAVIVETRRQPVRTLWSAPVRGLVVLQLWLLLPALAFVRHTHYLQNYYFLYWFPAPMLLLAWAGERLYALLRRWQNRAALNALAYAAAFAPVSLIAGQQLWTSIVGQDLLAQGLAGAQRVVDVRRAIATAEQLMVDRPDCDLVVLSDGGEQNLSRFGLLHEYFAPGRVRFAQAGIGVLVPEPCAVYFSVEVQAATDQWLQTYTHLLPEATLKTPEQRWTFHDLPATDRDSLAARWGAATPPLAAWANGVELLRMDARAQAAPGEALPIVSTWRVTAEGPYPSLHFGHYLLSADNRLVSQADGSSLDSRAWRKGDIFQTAFTLSLPDDLGPGAYDLAVALYRFPEIQRVPLSPSGEDLARLQKIVISAP